MDITPPSLWALTGERGIGKTTFCRTLIELAITAGWDVAGLLSRAVFEGGVKTGILVESLRGGETQPLACAALSLSLQPATFDLQLGSWLFSSAALAWGNQVLGSSLACDLFIVDELGPLEFLRGEGWVNALEALCHPRYRLGLVVIRPELLETAREVLPITQVIAIDASDNLTLQAQAWWKTMRTNPNRS